MKKYNLEFISDKDIYDHVRRTIESYRRNINLKEFNSNIVDPIKLTFDAKVYGKTMEQIIEDECFRQIDKSNSNTIGYFIKTFSNMQETGGLYRSKVLMWKIRSTTFLRK